VWVLILLFGLSCLVMGWTCFGYYLYLRCLGLVRPRPRPPLDCDRLPFVSVIVPCYNEKDQILAKYVNLREQDYPKALLEIVFADGGSTDGTLAMLEPHVQSDPTVRLVRCPEKGKIHQLNYVLPQLKGEIVVNADVDGQMELDAISALAREFCRDPQVAVVGAYVYPAKPLEVDRCYWLGQNRGRLLESDVHAASIVIAVCYAFRRSLIAQFPPDVVADDIYVAFEANTRGLRTVYCRDAVVSEVRGPSTHEEFFAHKFRKSNAFLREALRFLYRMPDMPKGWKMIYTTKVAQLLLLPWAGFWFLLLGVSLLTLGRYDVVLIGFGFLAVLLAATSATFRRIPTPDEGPTDFFTLLTAYVYSNFLLLATGLSYPFYRQTSSYAKVGEGGPGAASGPEPSRGG